MSVAVLYLPNIFFKLLMRQVPVHDLVALLQITLSRSQLLTGHFKQLSKVILKYLALSCSVSLGGALLRQSEMTFFPGPYRTSRSHLVNLYSGKGLIQWFSGIWFVVCLNNSLPVHMWNFSYQLSFNIVNIFPEEIIVSELKATSFLFFMITVLRSVQLLSLLRTSLCSCQSMPT